MYNCRFDLRIQGEFVKSVICLQITTGYNLEDDRCECVALQDYKENEQVTHILYCSLCYRVFLGSFWSHTSSRPKVEKYKQRTRKLKEKCFWLKRIFPYLYFVCSGSNWLRWQTWCISPLLGLMSGKMSKEPKSMNKWCENCCLLIGHKSHDFCGWRKGNLLFFFFFTSAFTADQTDLTCARSLAKISSTCEMNICSIFYTLFFFFLKKKNTLISI